MQKTTRHLMPSDGGAGGDAAVHLEEEKLQEKWVGGKPERKTEWKRGRTQRGQNVVSKFIM